MRIVVKGICTAGWVGATVGVLLALPEPLGVTVGVLLVLLVVTLPETWAELHAASINANRSDAKSKLPREKTVEPLCFEAGLSTFFIILFLNLSDMFSKSIGNGGIF